MTAKVRVRISDNYAWRNPDVGQLASLVRDHVASFAGDGAHVTASVETQAPVYEKTFDTIEEWVNELSASHKSITFSTYKGADSFYLRLDPIQRSASLNISAVPEREVAARALLATVCKALGLEDTRRGESSTMRIEGNYRVSGFEGTGLIGTIDKLVREFGDISYFDGEVRLLAASELRYSFRTLGQWKAKVVDSWKDLAGASYWLEMASIRANVNYQKDRQQLRLSLEAPETTRIDSIFSSLVQSLDAIPLRDAGESSMKGERRRYFPEAKADIEWFQQCLSIVTSWNTGQTSFQGRFRTLDQELSTRDVKEWKKEILSRWNELSTIYGWFSSFELSQTLDIDLVREIISLEIQGRTTNVVNANFSAFESALKLKRFYGNPYQYRKFARSYRIEEWKTEAAIPDAINAALIIAFGDKAPAINSAFVTVGTKAEDLQPFPTVASFTERLRQGEYTTARLGMEGPKGVGLGISVDRPKSRLWIKSSLGRQEFEKVVGAFEERIDLGRHRRRS